MAQLNSPLGTTTPEIFLDNVKRADELVNGPAGTVNDRAGEPLDIEGVKLMVMWSARMEAAVASNLCPLYWRAAQQRTGCLAMSPRRIQAVWGIKC